MNVMKRAVWIAVLALASLATAQETFSFKTVRKQGDIAKTKFAGRIDVQGMTLLINFISTDEVLKVNPDGTIQVRNTSSEASLTAGGVEQLPPDNKPEVSEVRLRMTGELLESSSPRMPIAMQRRGNRLTALMPPANPVKIGDSWGHKWEENAELNMRPAEVTYNFVAVEKVGNWNAAKVEFDFKETGGTQPMTAKGTLWFRTDTFEIVKSDYTVGNYRAPGVFVGLTAMIKTERLP